MAREEPLKVALAGAGMISWYHLVGWRKLEPRIRLVAVCDPNRAQTEKRAAEFGIPKVYTDRDAMLASEAIDALDVASPRETHAAWVEAAAGYPPRAPDRLEVIGTTASALFEESTLRLLGPVPRIEAFDNDRGYQASFDGVIAHFVECLASGAPFETGPADNLETLRLVEHAYWAAGRHPQK